jgi:integrase
VPRKGDPETLAPFIYVLENRIRVVAKAGGRQRERSFPLTADLNVMIGWQLTEKANLLAASPSTAAPAGTLKDDAPAYLATLTGQRRKDDAALAAHWLACGLASMPRAEITRSQIKAQMATWQEAGVAANTINHRVRLLRNVYRELDGEDAPNPTDKIRKLPGPEAEARDVPYDLLEAIIAWAPDRGAASAGETRPGVSLSKDRARAMLWTGLPPSILMKVRRVHFNRAAATLKVQPRRKGRGTKGETIPLLPEAVNALQAFFDHAADGAFSTHSFYKWWHRAQQRFIAQLKTLTAEQGGDPATIELVRRIRPYDIRHSFGSEAWRRSKNLLGLKKLMLHARLSTTERYITGVVDEAAASVLAAWQTATAQNTPPAAAEPRRRRRRA